MVLGAGFGGLELSRRLSDELGDEVRVTLVDRNDGFTIGFSKFEILFEGRDPADVRYAYRDISMPGVEFRREEITSIDAAKRHVTTDGGSYEADYLVVALGADYAPEATPGFVEDGYEFYSIAGAQRLRDHLPSVQGGKVVVAVLGVPYKCPPGPYEFLFLLHDRLTERGIRDSFEISFFNPMPAPLPPSPETSEAIRQGMTDRGIPFEFGHRVAEIDPGKKVARFGDGREVPYDLFVGIPVHRVPDVVQASGLTKDGNDGWVKVDQETLETPYRGVYAIGDCADAPVPRAGVFAEDAAKIAAADIIAKIRRDDRPGRYKGLGTCYLEFGGGKVGKVVADFLSGPKPELEFVEPSLDFRRDKEEFATSRRARWFGG